MKFWRIHHPEYDSDYRCSYINGSLKHPFGLPGVECMCATWGGGRILPYECPESFRGHEHITERWPIWIKKHESLQKELMAALSISGDPFVALRPGDEFQPCFLDVPSYPRADFLWPSIDSFVVSQRIKNAIVESCPDDVAVYPVTLRKIGKREAELPPPMPSTGEPEDIIDEVPVLKTTSGVGPYFEIVVLKESGNPPGVTLAGTCPRCKRASVDVSKRELRMTADMWKRESIFLLATTCYVVVTDELRRRIARYHPTNVAFQEM